MNEYEHNQCTKCHKTIYAAGPLCFGCEREAIESKSLSVSDLQTIVHDNAIDHGWHFCSMCKGEKWIIAKTRVNNKIAAYVVCPQCEGSGKHRNPAEAVALIMAEGAEALEALREPEKDHLCDKCSGIGQVSVKTQAGDREFACDKCNGTGLALCGSRYVEELADIAIRTFDESGRIDANLARAIELKIAYNKTRPYRHGKKF